MGCPKCCEVTCEGTDGPVCMARAKVIEGHRQNFGSLGRDLVENAHKVDMVVAVVLLRDGGINFLVSNPAEPLRVLGLLETAKHLTSVRMQGNVAPGPQPPGPTSSPGGLVLPLVRR